MSRRLRASALGLLAGIGLSLAGCSQSPLSPVESGLNGGAGGSSTPPPIVTFASNGTVDYVWAPVGAAVDASASVSLASTLPRSVSSSQRIDGSRGGTLRAGRFTVKIPAGAFSGPATVTVSMADSTVMICDLTIAPGSANKFQVPAQLTADLSAPNITDATNFTMYWYDPAGKVWVNLFAKSTISGTNVTSSLEHFSTYAAGKAGW